MPQHVRGDAWGVGTYEVEATWTTVELETKTAFYADDEAVTWSVLDGEIDQQIEDAGGHVVGLVLAMSYPTDDETPGGLCTGQETDVPDIVSGTATKGEWTLEASDSGFGGHEVNLTWHDQAILDAGVATNLSEQEVLDRFVFGDEARGAFDLTVLVDAQAHNSALCSHSDDGEEVTTVASLLVIDLTVTPAGMDDESSSALAVGTGAIPSVIFAPSSSPWWPWWLCHPPSGPVPAPLCARRRGGRARGRVHVRRRHDDRQLSGSRHHALRPVRRSGHPVGLHHGHLRDLPGRARRRCKRIGAVAHPRHPALVGQVPLGSGHRPLPNPGLRPATPVDPARPDRDDAHARRDALRPDPTNNVRTIAIMFLVYNIFTSLQDVSTDALAVDVLQPHEVEKVNSYMFTSKTVGGAIGGAGLGTIIVFTGLKGAILLQIPILAGLMIAPMMMTERPGERRFPWKRKPKRSEEEGVEAANQNFADIFAKIRTALSLRSAYLSIVLSLTVSLHFLLIPVCRCSSCASWAGRKPDSTPRTAAGSSP